MIPLDKQHNTRMPPSTAFNLSQLKFESADSADSDSSMVWIILFSLLIFISVLSNSLYILYNIRRRCLTHTILSVFFLLNIVDYVLLLIEFSSDHPGQFSPSQAWCSLYQLLLQASPLLTSLTLVYLIYQAWGLRCLSSTPALLTLIISTTTLCLWLLVPSVIFSEIAVYPSTARYCVIDLSGLASRVGLDINSQHILTAIYFILYKSVLSYWVPLSLTVLPVVKMMKKINFSDDKYFSQSLNLTIVTSFFVFNLPLALLEVTRQAMISLSPHQQAWTIQVFQSLFLLLSFFYHIFRPVACLVLNSSEIVKIGGYQHVQTAGESA